MELLCRRKSLFKILEVYTVPKSLIEETLINLIREIKKEIKKKWRDRAYIHRPMHAYAHIIFLHTWEVGENIINYISLFNLCGKKEIGDHTILLN